MSFASCRILQTWGKHSVRRTGLRNCTVHSPQSRSTACWLRSLSSSRGSCPWRKTRKAWAFQLLLKAYGTSNTSSEISLCWRHKSNRLIGWIIYPASLFSLYLPTQVNDTTVSLPVSSESGAGERVNDSTTSKPQSDEAEGSVQDRNRGCGKSWLWIPFKCSLSCISTVGSTAAAESQTSRFPRFSPQSRFKLSTQKACPEKMLLPGVSSLKGAHRISVSAFFLSVFS